MKGAQIRAALEDRGFLVFTAETPSAYKVRSVAGRQVAWYDLHDDGAFRFGWIERADHSHIDCLSWPEFETALADGRAIIATGVNGTSVTWPSGAIVQVTTPRLTAAMTAILTAHEGADTDPLRAEIAAAKEVALANVLAAGDPA